MGMIAKILKKKAQSTAKKVHGFFEPHKEEKKYPLGFRLDATVRFDPTPFILAGGKLKMEAPEGDFFVAAISEFSIAGVACRRFYIKNLEDREYVLQMAGAKGKEDLTLYQTMDEIFPGSEDEWDTWLNPETGLIGYIDFNTPDGDVYARALRNGGPQCVSPVSYEERIEAKDVSMTIDHQEMYYEREIEIEGAGEPVYEYLCVAREEDDEGAQVRIMAGTDIDAHSLSVM
jgi:hypothetical protein